MVMSNIHLLGLLTKSFYRSSTLMELQNKYMIMSIVYGEKKTKITYKYDIDILVNANTILQYIHKIGKLVKCRQK